MAGRSWSCTILLALAAMWPLAAVAQEAEQEPAAEADAPAAETEAPAAEADAPPAAAEEPEEEAEIPPELTIDESGWEGGAFSRPDNPDLIGYCGIAHEYENGITVVFATNLQNQTNINLIDSDWTLSSEERHQITLDIDGQVGGEGPAFAASATVLVIPLGEVPEIIEALRQGNVLRLTTSLGDFSFPLSGTFAALAKLNECVAVAQQVMAEVPPAPPPAAEPEPGEEGSPTEGITLEALNDILTAAGLEEVTYVPPEQVPHNEMDLRFIWQVGHLNGALHQEPRPSDAIEIDEFSERYVAILQARCPGEFTVTYADSEIFRERYALRTARAECVTEDAASVLALVFALDQYFYSVFYHEATMEHADDAVAESEKIANLIRELAGGETQPSGD